MAVGAFDWGPHLAVARVLLGAHHAVSRGPDGELGCGFGRFTLPLIQLDDPIERGVHARAIVDAAPYDRGIAVGRMHAISPGWLLKPSS